MKLAERAKAAVRPAKSGGSNTKKINLALQGGGAHGAYTWGVIDRILEDGRIEIEAISGTSAGAMNAVVLVDGWVKGGRDGAREALHKFWRGVSRAGGLSAPPQNALDAFMSFWQVPRVSSTGLFNFWSHVTSPFDLRPEKINPLRDLLNRQVDFDSVQSCNDIRLFISATNVRTGKIKVFRDKEVDADAVAASACLPLLFEAIEVDDEAYWDGGYMGNPALFPFFSESSCDDILLVQINPIIRDEVPTNTHEIMERVSEITFNASLLREFRAIDFVNRLIEENRLDGTKYRQMRLHRIDADAALNEYSASTKFDTRWTFFEKLYEVGRESADAWLKENYRHIGNKQTLDLRQAFS
ncbi:patatin-like phospholipase family protein [Tepidamorphus sp. 3E244]|uniref:patatin-like phospholipase family protein n=1 Tax=Tepidamorphus sp. 3E244 TaxID=3385498 RepID=UPI0038FC41B2